MTAPLQRPVVGIPTCRKMLGDHPFHAVGEKYITAVLDVAETLPLLVPAIGREIALEGLLDSFDGLLFTGSESNVEPHHYGGEPSVAGTLHDPARDATTLPLIRAAVAAGVPVLGICRGFQEMNVAFGGTLWQRVHESGQHHDHREDPSDPLDVQYGPSHEVTLVAGGLLHRLHGTDRIEVNSLHWQGVKALGATLAAEAFAPDGLVEAFRVTDSAAFAVAVQWHPEWKAASNPFSRTLFRAFGDAARKRAQARRRNR